MGLEAAEGVGDGIFGGDAIMGGIVGGEGEMEGGVEEIGDDCAVDIARRSLRRDAGRNGVGGSGESAAIRKQCLRHFSDIHG